MIWDWVLAVVLVLVLVLSAYLANAPER